MWMCRQWGLLLAGVEKGRGFTARREDRTVSAQGSMYSFVSLGAAD